MWYERFVIIVPSLAHRYEPWKFLNYHMTWVEAAILLGSFGWFFMWFLLFLRFLPGLSIAEIKEVLPPPMRNHHDVAEHDAHDEAQMVEELPTGYKECERPMSKLAHGRPGRLRATWTPPPTPSGGCARRGSQLTVYSPTPRHELEEALETQESPVRIFTLVGAFTGTAAGTALATWASIDWPLVVGGKEIISLPAFSVIMFELTILLGAL